MITVFQVLCLTCKRRWMRIGQISLVCPFCSSTDYVAVRERS